MPLPEVLPIIPFTRPARGSVALPGSKSLTNRAMLLAALGDGPATLDGALHSEDTAIMAESLSRLGFDVAARPAAGTLRGVGQGGRIPAQRADLHVGNAGTAARFLTALCAAAPAGVFTIDGVRTGFIVDSVTEVLKIPRSAIGPTPALTDEQARLISRVANLERQKRMILLIDVDHLLEQHEIGAVVEASGPAKALH